MCMYSLGRLCPLPIFKKTPIIWQLGNIQLFRLAALLPVLYKGAGPKSPPPCTKHWRLAKRNN